MRLPYYGSRMRWLLSATSSVVAILAIVLGSGRAEAASNAEIESAIRRGVVFLRENAGKASAGHSSLGAYAMIKADEPPTSPAVAAIIQTVLAKVSGGVYTPRTHHIYEAGVDVMLLEAADPERFRPQMQAIVNYLIAEQRPNGHWDYPHEKNGGDTSISQYAVLGFWSAERAGIRIPLEVWDRAALWFLKHQLPNRAFAYHPAGGQKGPSHSMTAAGVGSLLVTKEFLFRESETKKTEPKPVVPAVTPGTDGAGKKGAPPTTFGILEKIDFSKIEPPEPDAPLSSAEARAQEEARRAAAEAKARAEAEARAYRRITTAGAIEGATKTGIGWLINNYTIDRPTGWGPMYYLYGMERFTALAKLSRLGSHDWFDEGSSYLVQSQIDDGGWKGVNVSMSRVAATSFAILFLTKSTQKIVGPLKSGPSPLGVGLLAGGRGLPDPNAKDKQAESEIQKDKLVAPISDLLAELADPKNLNVEAAQESLVDIVQLGNREQLVGQKDLLRKLAGDPRDEVRRTAFWALGRCDDLRVVPLLLQGLQDPNVDVMVEARNSLCTLARKPRGLGLSDSPLPEDSDELSDAEKLAAVDRWRTEAIRKWRDWYFSVRSYDERDDLAEELRRQSR